jgi:hypothetical protein
LPARRRSEGRQQDQRIGIDPEPALQQPVAQHDMVKAQVLGPAGRAKHARPVIERPARLERQQGHEVSPSVAIRRPRLGYRGVLTATATGCGHDSSSLRARGLDPGSPIALMQEAFAVHAVSSGRLALGIGVSDVLTIRDALGLWSQDAIGHLREYLTVCAQARTGRIDFDGDHY